MIHTNRIVTVGEQESIIDRPIVLYRGDREVEIEFTLVGNEFTFSEEGNVIKSVNASHGQLVLNTPSGEHMFSELAECHEGKVVFVVTKEMIDEFIEMGFYSFQIRLYDSAEMKSRVTIPPVLSGFDIRNPIAAEDETNVVDQGIVDYARIFKDQSNEELPTFTWDGEYVKTEWVHHDVITENKMNKIEDALYSINANIKETDVVMLNALDNVKKDADKYVKEHMAEVEADVEEFERNLNTGVEKFKVDTNAAMTAHKNEVSEELEGFSGEIESINSQLERVENKQFITPEDFEGTDHDKLQQALDYVISNKMDLCINKKYTIDNELVINKGRDARYKTKIFGGGTIVRIGEGNIFSALNSATSDIYFEGLSFEGAADSNVTCFDCGDAHLIRFKIDKCCFSNLSYVVYTTSYLQTVYITNSTFTKINKAVLEFGGCFDLKISNIVYELSSGQFINHLKIGMYTGCSSFVLRDSVLEGITGDDDLIRVSGPHAFIITGCYFEKNNGRNIVFYNTYECGGVTISNNVHLGTSDENQAFITWSGILHDCITSCNSISGIKINDTTGITKGRVISQGNFCSLSDKNITSDNTQVIDPFKSNISANINKVGSTNFIVSTEAERILDETLICTITTPIHSGFTVRIKGGGFQGGVGIFTIERTYHIVKYNNAYTITEKGLDVTGGKSPENGILCKENSEGKIGIYVKSTSTLVSSYFLTMHIDGQVYSVN